MPHHPYLSQPNQSHRHLSLDYCNSLLTRLTRSPLLPVMYSPSRSQTDHFTMLSQNVNYYFAQKTPWFPTQSKCQSPLYGMFNDRIPEKKTSELRPEGGRKREPHEHFEEEHS